MRGSGVVLATLCALKLCWILFFPEWRLTHVLTSDSGRPLKIEKPKTVLLWTFVWAPEFRLSPPNHKELVQCEQHQCIFTNNRSVLMQTDAVVFLHTYLKSDDVPPVKLPSQRWVIQTGETPKTNPPFPAFLDGLINWTMTYHRSADIFMPYGIAERRMQPNGPPKSKVESLSGLCPRVARCILGSTKVREDRDRTLVEFGKRISHNCMRMVVKKRRFHWVNQEHGQDSAAIEDMVENEAMKMSFERPF